MPSGASSPKSCRRSTAYKSARYAVPARAPASRRSKRGHCNRGTSSCCSASRNACSRRKSGCSAARQKKAGSRRLRENQRRLEGAANRINVSAGFGIGRVGGRGDGRIDPALLLSTHGTAPRHAVVHLRIRGDGDLVGQVRRADDDSHEAVAGGIFQRSGGGGRGGRIARLDAQQRGGGLLRVR